MPLKKISDYLNGLILFEPTVFEDSRGFFLESYRKSDLEKEGIFVDFVQDNHSKSQKNVLRGLHYQIEPPMGKLIRVTKGSALVIELDIRVNSDTFGQHEKFLLTAQNKQILWVPAGFANGFYTLEGDTEVQYKCTSYWNPEGEGSILWNDEVLNIDWQADNPIISQKDSEAMTIEEYKKGRTF